MMRAFGITGDGSTDIPGTTWFQVRKRENEPRKKLKVKRKKSK